MYNSIRESPILKSDKKQVSESMSTLVQTVTTIVATVVAGSRSTSLATLPYTSLLPGIKGCTEDRFVTIMEYGPWLHPSPAIVCPNAYDERRYSEQLEE